MEEFFKLRERKTDVKTEILAGITTFMTMAYVLAVQPSAIVGFGDAASLTDANGYVISKSAILIMCALVSGVITIFMGLYANFPFALSTGMGTNFLLGALLQDGSLSFGSIMSIILISGIIFLALTIFGIRDMIVKMIPKNIKVAISASIGFFVAYLGFKNTGIILVCSIFFNVLFGTITAFILERFQFRFKNLIMSLFFLGMLIPSFVTEIARFKIINGLGLYNTLGAPIVIYVASDLMQLYIYRQFISTLPVSLDESALLDGCSYFGLFTRIIFPLLAPATATVVIIKAITIINDMYIPYLYMPKNKLRTLTTFLMNYANAQQGSWQNLAAGIIIIMLPTIVIYLFFQKYILAGIAAGAVKE